MPDTVYAICHGCGKPHQVTVSSTFRLHRNGHATCPGSGQRPTKPVTSPQSRARTGQGLIRQPAPGEPADGRSCDGGDCDAPSIGWRWYRDLREWLPVCGLHMAGPPGPTRIHDPGAPDA
jgi:hypothetical protein